MCWHRLHFDPGGIPRGRPNFHFSRVANSRDVNKKPQVKVGRVASQYGLLPAGLVLLDTRNTGRGKKITPPMLCTPILGVAHIKANLSTL